MGTINGFGTTYYGWQHREEGKAEAAKWFVVLFLPVFPIKRHLLRILRDPDSEPTVSAKEFVQVISPHKEIRDYFHVLEELPLDKQSVLKTLFKAYLLLP